MSSAIIRILLRYIAGYLVAKGILSPETSDSFYNDPELVAGLEIGLGALVGAATEGWYYLARRMGWAT